MCQATEVVTRVVVLCCLCMDTLIPKKCTYETRRLGSGRVEWDERKILTGWADLTAPDLSPRVRVDRNREHPWIIIYLNT